MDLAEAVKKASAILDEERERPTVSYLDTGNDWVARYKEMTPDEVAEAERISKVPRLNVIAMREQQPRIVTETPQIYTFSSVNFELLVTVLSQVHSDDRPAFINSILARILKRDSIHRVPNTHTFPRFNGYVSELPLVAEFCIRTGYVSRLLQTLDSVPQPTYGVVILLKQLEETIALSFNLFTEKQLEQIPGALSNLRLASERLTYASSGKRGGVRVKNPHYIAGMEQEATAVVNSIDGIAKECVQAGYWYLKGGLQQIPNLEVNRDKTTVESYLLKLGFTQLMTQALNAAESDYKATATPFELKNCLGHLRSFLEHVHLEAGRSIAKAAALTSPTDWDTATAFLRKQNFMTGQQEKFARGLHGLLSDEGVHAVIADREFARLLRNMVIEYGVMFLTVLDKKGVKITASDLR